MSRWKAVPLVVLLTAVGLLTSDRAAAGSDIVATANGGYHWTIAEDDVFGVEVLSRTLTVNARKYADGTAQGIFVYHQLFLDNVFRLTMSVTCFNVYDGNRAKVGGMVEVSNDPGVPPGVFAWFQAIDGGEGRKAPPDQSTLVGVGDEATNEAFCNSPDGPRFGPWDVTGNLQVSG